MASKRQIEANRANAKRSTGPKTTFGKARSNRNALRHGLARPESEQDAGRLETIASAIAASLARSSLSSEPMDFARAKFRLWHIRDVRHGILATLLESPSPQQMRRLVGLERYERAARAEHRHALKALASADITRSGDDGTLA